MKTFFKFFIFILFIKIAVGIFLPLSSDEAYYWFWGQNPQWSYYDHPAMVAWLFYLGDKIDHFFHLLFGLENIQFVRIPGILLAHSTLYLWYLLVKKHIDQNQQNKWLLFVVLSPLWGIGSLILTPDLPLVFFWSLAIYFLNKILDKEPSLQSTIDYILLGLSLGLGFCSKYHIVLFVPCLLAFLSFEKLWGKIDLKKAILSVLFGLLACFPVLYWNYLNDFISFKFQLQHGLQSETQWQWRWLVEYILGQFFLILPPLFFKIIRKPQQTDLKSFYYFGWGTLVFFLITSLRAKVEANWPVAAYPALVCLGFIYIQNNKKILWSTFAVWALAWILVLTEASHHWVPIEESKIKTSELHKFDKIAQIYGTSTEAEKYFANTYQMASHVSYLTRYKQARPLFKLNSMSRLDYFDYLTGSEPTTNDFYIFVENEQHLPDKYKKLGFVENPHKELNEIFFTTHITKKGP